jgi:hypothetical protein
MKGNINMQKQKRLTLNSEKRTAIANVFQSHFEREDSPVIKKYNEAKETYNTMRQHMKIFVEKIVRNQQPIEDVETIRSMIKKYDSAGGQLYEDSCFLFKHHYTKVDDDGNEHSDYDSCHVKFGLGRRFGLAYYRDDMKAKNLDPDYYYRWGRDDRRNPRYYETETACEKYLGYNTSSNDDKSVITPRSEWNSDFQLWVIGTSYCHTREFKVNEDTFNVLKQFNDAKENLILCHEKIFDYVEDKMKKLRLGLKSYRYFDQAKSLADKLGVALNESVLNESSSLALSVYSPENLASLLEDKVEMTREEKIAMFRNQQNVSVN